MDNMDFNNDLNNLNNLQTGENEYEAYSEGKNGSINIHSIPVRKSRFKKAASFIATMLVAAIVGGAAGGGYVKYMMSKNPPANITIAPADQGGAKTANYTPPASLIGKIAEQVGPAVVGITTEAVSQGLLGQGVVQESSGSGIIFDPKGYIVTNQHVIEGGSNIHVILPGRKEPVKARVIGEDAVSDIAVLKIELNNLPAVKFGDSDQVRVGDLAIAIGNPLGQEFAGSVTSGIISALNREMNLAEGDYTRRYKLIQTDAAINPGNSGGALINENGEVIGINTVKFKDLDVEGMGFAIPINEVKEIIDQLLNNGYVSRPYLGISVFTIDEALADQYNTPVGAGVQTVNRGSAAEAAGIKPLDVIIGFEDIEITSHDQLIRELEKYKVGDSVKLKIWRDGSTLTIPVTLGEMNQSY